MLLPLLAPALLAAGIPPSPQASPATLSTGVPAQTATDLRRAYDVQHYDLDWRIEPAEQSLAGTVAVRARVGDAELSTFVLDLTDEWTVHSVSSGDVSLEHQHGGGRLSATLADPAPAGSELEIVVTYSGYPEAEDSFSGFHWATTADGRPWVNTSCQGPGAHSWWPCKSSYFHPNDKPDDGIDVRLDVPEGLVGVSNGRLVSESTSAGRSIYQWKHPYPLETYSVTLNVAPYVVVESELELAGIEEPVPWVYYVLPENAEKAAVQFRQMPRLLRVFSEAFGPWPFPRSKVALVETNFWGMEHSTAVAYGSSYPAWCAETGNPDRYARRNRDFDYILVHEMAHEWWGNAVSADHWGHFWIHEGLGTYAEAVWLEFTKGREAADAYFERSRGYAQGGQLYRGDHPASGEAYSGLIYSKGAWVLNTLRYYIDDDDVWWQLLRTFQERHRYGTATTESFRAILEELTKEDWAQFFDEWVYGTGAPALKGRIFAEGGTLHVDVANDEGKFHVPLYIAGAMVDEDGRAPFRMTVVIPPGGATDTVELVGTIEDLEVENFHRVLGSHSLTVTR